MNQIGVFEAEMINRIATSNSSDGSTTAAESKGSIPTAVKQGVGKFLGNIEQFIATKPEVSLGVALGIGVVTGWVLKRRK